MPGPDLRPLTFGQLLDQSFAMYRKNFRVLAGIAIVPAAATIPWTLSGRFIPSGQANGGNAAVFLGSLLFFFGFMAVYYIFFFIALGAMSFAVSDLYLGRSTSAGEAFQKVRSRIGSLLHLWFAIFLRMFGCAITIILMPVAFLMYFWYSFSVAVLLFEGVPVGQALKRSRLLTKGIRDRIFVIGLLVGIISYVIALVCQVPLVLLQASLVPRGQMAPLWMDVLLAVGSAAAGAVTTPLFMISITLLYYNTRIVREGYDLQLLMERLGPESVPAT